MTPYPFLYTHTKADQQLSCNTVLLLRRDDGLNPIPILRRYLEIRDHWFPLNPELWSRSDGSISCYPWFTKRLKPLLPGNIGGSSLRSGGADHLARLGTDHALIQACGRWASNAYHTSSVGTPSDHYCGCLTFIMFVFAAFSSFISFFLLLTPFVF